MLPDELPCGDVTVLMVVKSRNVPALILMTSIGVGARGFRFCGLCVCAAVVVFAEVMQVVTSVAKV